MNEETTIHIDLSAIDRERLESICNEALGCLSFDTVKDILADHSVLLEPHFATEMMN